MSKGKTYRTANGQEVDMDRLARKNEMTRAVGNMKTNARGDLIDNDNKTVEKRAERVQKGYRKQIGNVAVDVPVTKSKKDQERIAETIEGLDEPVVEPVAEKPKPKTRKKKVVTTEAAEGGLAAAIAKTQEKE